MEYDVEAGKAEAAVQPQKRVPPCTALVPAKSVGVVLLRLRRGGEDGQQARPSVRFLWVLFPNKNDSGRPRGSHRCSRGSHYLWRGQWGEEEQGAAAKRVILEEKS